MDSRGLPSRFPARGGRIGRNGCGVLNGNNGCTGGLQAGGIACFKPRDTLDLGKLAHLSHIFGTSHQVNRPLQERPSDTAGRPAPVDRGRAGLAIAVFLLAFPLSVLLGDDHGLWLPALGVGIAILSWTSWWVLLLLALEVLACRLPFAVDSRAAIAESVLLVGQIGASWWVYHRLAKGSRWLEDPLSGMLFLLIVPGVVAALFALAQAGLAETRHYLPEPFGPLYVRL